MKPASSSGVAGSTCDGKASNKKHAHGSERTSEKECARDVTHRRHTQRSKAHVSLETYTMPHLLDAARSHGTVGALVPLTTAICSCAYGAIVAILDSFLQLLLLSSIVLLLSLLLLSSSLLLLLMNLSLLSLLLSSSLLLLMLLLLLLSLMM